METAILVLLAGLSAWALLRAKGVSVGTDAAPLRSTENTDADANTAAAAAAAPAIAAQVAADAKAAALAGAAGSISASLQSDEPHGWFAAVVSHGAAVLGLQLDYMKRNHHLLPYLAASFRKATIASDTHTELDYTRSGLWVHKTCETPCPSLPGCGPAFFRSPSAQGELAKHWASFLDKCASNVDFGEPNDVTDDPRTAWTPWAFDTFESQIADEREWPGATQHRLNQLSRWLDETAYFFPARACAAWSVDFASHDRGEGRGLLRAPVVLAPFFGNAIDVPTYYRASAARRADFWARLIAWYHRASFVVWAGEMLRVHVREAVGDPPPWWADHCAAWGVGVVTAVKRATLGTASGSMHNDSRSTVEKMLRLVVRHTPPPGSPGSCGAQIVPATTRGDGAAVYTRTLLDIPDTAGSVDPPYHVPWWRTWAADSWARDAVKGWSWTNLLSADTIIKVEASIVSAGFASAATAVVSSAVSAVSGATVGALASKLATVALQGGFRMMNGVDPRQAWNWGDVVGMIGQSVEAMGLDTDRLDGVPNELWGALQKAGAEFPNVAGADMDKVRGYLSDVRNTFLQLRADGWPYIQQAYGGLGLSGHAANKAGASNLIR